MIYLFFAAISAISIFIGILIASIPYVARPDIVFGVRLNRNVYQSPLIRSMKMENCVYVLLISSIFSGAFLLGSTYVPTFIFALTPMLELVPMVPVYFHFRSRVLRIKEEMADVDYQKKISAFVPVVNNRISNIWYFLPWIEIIIFVMVGVEYYPYIPDKMAIHFGINGQANAFAAKSILSVFSLLLFVAAPLTAFFDLLSFSLLRVRSNANTSTPKTSSTQMKGFNKGIAKLLAVINAIVVFSMFLGSLLMWNVLPPGYSHILVLPVFIILPIVLFFIFKNGQGGWKLYPGLKEKEDESIVRDDDGEWTGGLIYHNKDDSSLLVPKRYGVGYTFNFSNKLSWIILILLLALPVLAIYLASLM